MYSEGGQGFVVLHSTTNDGDDLARSSPQLAPGDVVTTLKNTVDKVVTEWGVAELRGRSIRERARGADRHRPPRPPRPAAVRKRLRWAIAEA